MSSVDHHQSCADKPLHILTARLEQGVHQSLRVELPLVVRLAEEVLPAELRRHPDLLPQLHLAVCLLRDAVTSHFDREEALLFPSLRLIEDGAGAWALDLHRLVPELMREQAQIQDLLAQLRLMTHDFVAPASAPMLRTLFASLRGVTHDLEARFRLERDSLYPQALSIQRPRHVTWREV